MVTERTYPCMGGAREGLLESWGKTGSRGWQGGKQKHHRQGKQGKQGIEVSKPKVEQWLWEVPDCGCGSEMWGEGLGPCREVILTWGSEHYQIWESYGEIWVVNQLFWWPGWRVGWMGGDYRRGQPEVIHRGRSNEIRGHRVGKERNILTYISGVVSAHLELRDTLRSCFLL